LAFCSLAGIYLTLQAVFIGMVQVIVYAGAIMVLFLFVIMYLNLGRDAETGIQIAVRRGLGWIVGAVMLAEGVVMFGRRWGLGRGRGAPAAGRLGPTRRRRSPSPGSPRPPPASPRSRPRWPGALGRDPGKLVLAPERRGVHHRRDRRAGAPQRDRHLHVGRAH